ncbi:MAG: 4Fe-4S binding protein [Chloroflexota bacterium]|nr:4Fe-4S binding protein [Chloroflexota bacterium]
MKPGAWQEITPAAIVMEPGSTVEVETGSWRVNRPVIDFNRCVHCMICWLFCPDSSFEVKGQKLVGVDYQHCKGCGICAVECPRKCISMVPDKD